MRKLSLPKNYLLSSGQKGASTIYIVVILMVIIFAVMFTGGTSSLLSGDIASPVTNTPTPSGTSPAGSVATPTPDPNWSINAIVDNTCKSGKTRFKSVAATANGTSNGYIALEIEDSPGSFVVDATSEFNSPSWNYTVTLPNDSGYNAKNWRLELFSGGTKSGSKWSGGTSKSIYSGTATGC